MYRSDDMGFDAVLREVADLHDVRSVGYGSGLDPLANIRAAAELRMKPKDGVVLRMNDKWTKIKRWYQGALITDEKLRDHMIDMVVYGAIWLQLDNEEIEDIYSARNSKGAA